MSWLGDLNKNVFQKGIGKYSAIGLVENMFNKQDGGSAPPSGPPPSVAILEQSGGAVLLANIAAGADPNTALASFLGVDPASIDSYLNQLDPSDRQAVVGIRNQIQQIQSNTSLRNQTVQNLVNDYPNIMANSIKQFGQMDNPVIAQAVQTINAKYGAGIGLSSGAATAATARATAGLSVDYAQKNFEQQLSEAEALRGFQQKMLGEGAKYGQTAAQSYLDRQAQVQTEQVKATERANEVNASQKSALFGAAGGLAGTAIGAYVGGPVGAAIGQQAGKIAGSTASSDKGPSQQLD